MENRVHNQDRAYRRGLVLGLTMAEIMVLIIFALLLALAAALKNSHDRLAARDSRVLQLEADLKVHEDTLKRLIASAGGKTTAEDIFKEMRAQKDKMQAAEAELSRLRPLAPKAKELDDIYQELRKAGIEKPESPEGKKKLADSMQIAKEAEQALRQQAGAAPDGKRIADMLALANQVMNESKRPGTNPDPAQLAQMLRDARSADQRVRDAIGQNRNLQEQLKRFGRGSDLPPCWANETTGRAEYIFDVTIGSTGFIISKNDLPGRSEQFENLPIQDIQFGQILSQAEFRRVTTPIRRWGESQEQKCKFYVRLYDQTKAEEKALFKKYMLTTEENFYKYLVQQ